MADERITGWEHRALREALTAAFNADELEQLVKERLDVTLPNVINVAAPFDVVTFDLVGWADRRGLLLNLFQAASEENLGNGTLERAVAAVFHAEGRHDQLQAIVNAGGGGADYLDAATWRDAFARAELGVCRVENAEGRPWGTGWLVANDLIVTNRHVWEAVLKDGRVQATARAAFNYRVLPGGGEAFAKRVGFALDAVVAQSPVEQLDFALLRLDRPVGGTAVANYAGAPLINPLRPKTYAFAGGEPAIVIQHPNGAPMKFAWGLVAPAASQTLPGRVLYQVNTDPGSSGSPVFLSDWRPVALHAQGHDPATNGGVAMSEIRTSCAQLAQPSGPATNGGVAMSEILPKIAPFLA